MNPPPRTVPELFLQAVERFDHPDFMRYKAGGEFVSIPSREFREEVELAAYGLIASGVQPGDRVSLLSENRPGWAFADLAVLSIGAWSVPIYTSLLADEIQYILEDSGSVACFVSTEEQLAKVEEIRERCPALRLIVTLDPIDRSDESVCTARHLLEQGAEERKARPGALERRIADIDPDGTASVLYTSGTTGTPKGVMLSHHNFVSNTLDSLQCLKIDSADCHLSILPLSHSFERTAGYYIMIHAGVSIAYAESFETLLDDMASVRPSVMTCVPRLYEKLYAGILTSANNAGGIKKRLVYWARRIAIAYAEKKAVGKPVGWGLKVQHRLADRLVYVKLRERVGGQLKFFISGGAPLAPVLAKFFYGAGLPILEGYGLTETSPVISVNTFEAFRFGTVGRPIPNVEVSVEPDPERPGGEGEILVRGPNIMQGYYNLPEKTADVMIEGGWFRTGDIGRIEDGFIRITDRKKDLLKTSGGKFIAPQPLENSLKTSKFVSQAVVVGDRRKHAAVLIVPNFDNLVPWAGDHGALAVDGRVRLDHPAVVDLYEQMVDKINEGKASFEMVKKFRLVERDFSIDSGELTPTLKVKRRVIEERYADVIDSMYGEEIPIAD